MKKFIGKNFKLIYGVVVLIALVVALVYLFWPRAVVSDHSFGSCLDSKGLAMYGSDTCPACKYQKSVLGDEFENVNYINCQFNLDECTEKKIEKYPTWVVDGQHVIGAQSLEALSELSGCGL